MKIHKIEYITPEGTIETDEVYDQTIDSIIRESLLNKEIKELLSIYYIGDFAYNHWSDSYEVVLNSKTI